MPWIDPEVWAIIILYAVVVVVVAMSWARILTREPYGKDMYDNLDPFPEPGEDDHSWLP